jgi:hypothetical protein
MSSHLCLGGLGLGLGFAAALLLFSPAIAFNAQFLSFAPQSISKSSRALATSVFLCRSSACV